MSSFAGPARSRIPEDAGLRRLLECARWGAERDVIMPPTRVLRAAACALFMLIDLGAFCALRAEPDDGAYVVYAAGEYDAAAARAAAIGGAANLTLAARALNAKAYFDDGRKSARRTADRAFDYAKAAIDLDPTVPEAHLQAALALAIRGARVMPIRAFLMNLPGRARREIDAAMALDQANPWAWSTSAAWRLEVARRGGPYKGADPDLGHEEFKKARALAPDNIPIAYECALRLAASGRAEWRADMLDALAAAVDGRPETAFERGVQARARRFAAAVAAGPEAEAAFIRAQP